MMLIVNHETFEQERKKRNWSKKRVAIEAKIQEKTLGRIKDGQPIREHTLDSIALAFGIDSEILLKKPHPLEVYRSSDFQNEMVGALYEVSPSWIKANAGLFFHALAEMFLYQHKEKVHNVQKEIQNLWGDKSDKYEPGHFLSYLKDLGKDFDENSKYSHQCASEFISSEFGMSNEGHIPAASFVKFLEQYVDFDWRNQNSRKDAIKKFGILLIEGDFNELHDRAIEKILEVPKDYQGRMTELGDYSGMPWGYEIARHSLWMGEVKPSEIPEKLRKSENYEDLMNWFRKRAQALRGSN